MVGAAGSTFGATTTHVHPAEEDVPPAATREFIISDYLPEPPGLQLMGESASRPKKVRGHVNFKAVEELLLDYPSKHILRVSGLVKFGESALFDVLNYFSAVGPVVAVHEVTCLKDATVKSSGVCFVVMARESDATYIKQTQGHRISERDINVRHFKRAKRHRGLIPDATSIVMPSLASLLADAELPHGLFWLRL